MGCSSPAKCALGVAVTFGACATSSPRGGGGGVCDGVPCEELDAIREAVLDALIEQQAALLGTKAEWRLAYCLSAEGGQSLSHDLLARLRASHPGVTLTTSCDDDTMGPQRGKTLSTHLSIHSIHEHRGLVRAECSEHAGPLFGRGYVVELERRDGRWTALGVGALWRS